MERSDEEIFGKNTLFLLSGLALGIATLGNLLNNYGAGYKVVSGWIALIMMVILTI